MTARKRAPRAGTVSAMDWVKAARRSLVENGVSSLKVEPLARELGVTPGSFYWHFKNRRSLYRAVLRDWLNSNVAPFFETFDQALEDPREQYLALAYVWVLSPVFDPALDVAIREWSKSSKLVKRLIRRVDANRINLYQSLLEDFGHNSTSALVRARTMYFHQIGYYTLKVEEHFNKRLLFIPYYAETITGDDWLLSYETPEQVRSALVNFKRRPTPSQRMAQRRLAAHQ